MRTKESQRKINSLILLTLCTATILITATYAWFTSQKDITVQNLQGKVNVTEGLQISLDGNVWTQSIDLSSIVGTTAFTTPYTGAVNIIPDELKPLSYCGSKVSGLTRMPLINITLDTANPKKVLTAENKTSGTESGGSGYIAFDLFLKDTSATTTGGTAYTSSILQLRSDASAGLVKNGSNEYVYTAGTENTIRVAFCKYDAAVSTTGVPATADQATVLQNFGYTTGATISSISIWEPNAYSHVDTIVSQFNSNNADKVIKTISGETTTYGEFTKSEYFMTYGLKTDITAEGAAANVTNIYDWSGTNSSYMSKQMTTPTKHATLTEGSTADVDYSIGTATTLLTTDDSQANFTIPANQITKIRVYAWMEGQDVDCTDLASNGVGFNINLALTKTH